MIEVHPNIYECTLEEIPEAIKHSNAIKVCLDNYSTDEFYNLCKEHFDINTNQKAYNWPEDQKDYRKYKWAGINPIYFDENNKAIYHGMQRVTSVLDKKGRPTGLFPAKVEMGWHFNLKPFPQGNIVGLHCVESGNTETGTLLADMIHAFDTLPNSLQNELRERTVTHNYIEGATQIDRFIEPEKYENIKYSTRKEKLTNTHNDSIDKDWEAQLKAGWQEIKRPIIRKNHTGREGLSISPHCTTSIVGEKDNTLLEYLFKHILKDTFTIKYRIGCNDIMFMDQILMLHKRWQGDMSKRLLNRIQLYTKGERFST